MCTDFKMHYFASYYLRKKSQCKINNMKKFIGLLASVAFLLVIFAFNQVPKKWVVPKKYQTMKNPVPSDDNSIKIGKGMYERHCLSCHGVTGKGNGLKAIKLDQTPGDFTTEDFKKETDGALFYKMTAGHKDMPSFKRRIPGNDDEIEGSFGKTGSSGDLINYIRTLNKK